MYEVEVKVPVEDRVALRERLDRAGAAAAGAVAQRDTYLDAPHRDFAATDEALRVRREAPIPDDAPADAEAAVTAAIDAGSDARLTYKGPLVEDASKTREEFETGVEDGDLLLELLDRLGFRPAATVEKRRERYDLDGYTVVLDEVVGVGTYLEVETDVETEAEVEAAREGAGALLADLGLDVDDQVRTSYLGMLLGEDG